jgi:hypothetical protein
VSEGKNETSICNYRVDVEMINIGKICENAGKSVHIAIEAMLNTIHDVLSALKINKYVIVRFDPNTYDTPLRVSFFFTKALEDEWGKEKIKEFKVNFYENAMNLFAKIKNIPNTNLLDAELLAVDQALHCLADAYGFDAYFIITYNQATNEKDAYRTAWLMVKKS